jgi:hypothetical protein
MCTTAYLLYLFYVHTFATILYITCLIRACIYMYTVIMNYFT